MTAAESPWRVRLTEMSRGASFAAGLGLYLRDPHPPERAVRIVRARLASREARFLELARRAIYCQRSSPYRALLRHVGCEPGDLARLLASEGLEGALAKLYQRGVYLSLAELQGRRPVVRGSLTLRVSLERLRSGLAMVPGERDGSDRSGQRLLHHAMFSGEAAGAVVSLRAAGALTWRHALWTGPSLETALWVVRYTVPGHPMPVWIPRFDASAADLPEVARRAARVVPAVSRLAGRPLTVPGHVPLEQPRPVVDWIRRGLAAGETPHVVTNVTHALTLVRAAEEMGADVTGAQISVGAEALTAARRDRVTAFGASIYASYGAKECGYISRACLAPGWADEMHLFTDCLALIQARDLRLGSEIPPDGLLVTSLRQWWPNVVLNVSLGDRADFSSGRCGCPMEEAGWSVRLHTVRSYEKLRVGEAPVFVGDVLEIMERTLPERFGGDGLCYQLVEMDGEAADGLARLVLVVDPIVGRIDESEVLATVGQGLAEHAPFFSQYRGRRGWIRIVRRRPHLTESGKLLPFCREAGGDDVRVAETLAV